MSLIALEFEDNQIFVAAARVAGRRVQIQRLFSFDIEGSDEEVAEQLKRELSAIGLSRSEAIAVVSRGNAEVRLVDVPPAPAHELPDIVRFVAKSEFASLNDNWMLDFVRLTGDHAATGQVLAAGVSPEMSNQIKSITEQAGLRLKHIVLRPFAAVDFVHDRLEAKSVQLLVDPNNQQVDLTIVDGDKVVATRTIRNAMTVESAEKLVPELRRTIASSSRALGGRPINQVIVLGADEAYLTIADKLRARLDCDVQVVDPMKHSSVNGRIECDRPSRYVALMGAMIQKGRGQKPSIDFLNPRRSYSQKGDYSKYWLYGSLAAVGLIAMAIFGWWKLSSQAREIADQKIRLQGIQDRNDGKTGRTSVGKTLDEVGKIDDWYANQVNWHEQLLDYSNLALTADDTIVDSLNATGPTSRTEGKLDLKVRSADFATENELIKSLSERFAVIPKRSDDLDDDKDYPIFSLLDLQFEMPTGKIEKIDRLAADLIAKQSAARQEEAKRKQLKQLPDASGDTGDDANGKSGESSTGKP